MLPAYALGNQSPAAILAAETNRDLLPAGRKFLTDVIAAGIKWTANDIMGQVAAAEAAEETTFAGVDTNDWRDWNGTFTALLVFLNTPRPVVQRDGTTKMITPQDAVMKYYTQV